MSQELKQHLLTKGIATSRTTSFNPAGNVKSTTGLFTKGAHTSHWESAIPDALQSIRSLYSNKLYSS